MNLRARKFLLASLVVAACLAAVGLYGYFALKRAEREFMESKWVRTTTGTVISKELFRCEQTSCPYLSSYGDRIEMKAGDSQRRIYYRINNFDQVPEPRRDRVIQEEGRRVAQFGERFTYDVDWYDAAKPGDKVEVRYQAFGDGNVGVVGVELKR
jgi:hypothetical protein